MFSRYILPTSFSFQDEVEVKERDQEKHNQNLANHSNNLRSKYKRRTYRSAKVGVLCLCECVSQPLTHTQIFPLNKKITSRHPNKLIESKTQRKSTNTTIRSNKHCFPLPTSSVHLHQPGTNIITKPPDNPTRAKGPHAQRAPNKAQNRENNKATKSRKLY